MNRYSAAPKLKTPRSDEVGRIASDWLVAHDHGLATEQKAEFEEWLRADARHETVYAQVAKTWKLLGEMPDRAFLAPKSVEPVRKRGRVVWMAASLAAAAIIALTFIGAWNRFGGNSGTPTDVAHRVSEMRLADGTVVQLNADGVIEVQYSEAERRVRLVQGEAHFVVAHNSARAFVVNVKGVNVRAVGTAFNVRLRSSSVEVLVTEGKVRVDDAAKGQSLLPDGPASGADGGAFGSVQTIGAASELIAGQCATLPIPAGTGRQALSPAVVVTLASSEIARTLAWRERQLHFVAERLSAIVDEFNHFNRHKLIISDSRLSGQKFGGTFPATDPEGFVQILEKEFGVVAERRGSETSLRLP